MDKSSGALDGEMALYCYEVLPPDSTMLSSTYGKTLNCASSIEISDHQESSLYCHEDLPDIPNSSTSFMNQANGDSTEQSSYNLTTEHEINSNYQYLTSDSQKRKQSESEIKLTKNDFSNFHLLTAALSVVESRSFTDGGDAMSYKFTTINDKNRGTIDCDVQNIPDAAIVSSDSSSTNSLFSESPSSPSLSYTAGTAPSTLPLCFEPKKKKIPWQHKRQSFLNSQHRNSTNPSCPSSNTLVPPKGFALFPQKVFEMISEKSKTHPEIISFTKDGKAFFIAEKSPLLGPILHEYFYHGNYPSLQRQLNMYGFKKGTSGPYRGAFFHPLFHRSSTFLELNAIERKCKPKSGNGHGKRRSKNCSSDLIKTKKTIVRKKKKLQDDEWENMFKLWCVLQKDIELRSREEEAAEEEEEEEVVVHRRMTTRGCKQKQQSQNREQSKQPQQLARWADKQRILYKDLEKMGHGDSILTEERVNLLNSVGFMWNNAT